MCISLIAESNSEDEYYHDAEGWARRLPTPPYEVAMVALDVEPTSRLLLSTLRIVGGDR
jgi:hypothetical protein